MLKRAFFFIICVSMLYKCLPGNSSSLRIAVASNLSEPIHEIIKEYQLKTNLNIDVIIGSSGKLTAQIQHGAPYDVFISADMDYLDTLSASNLLKDAPQEFVKGRLILWTFDETVDLNMDYLLKAEVIKVAIPNPVTAPYGRAAVEALTNIGYWNRIKDKAVFGESVTQTNQFILTKAVQAGITSHSLIRSPQFQERGQWFVFDNDLYEPILHGIGIIRSSGNYEHCKNLVQFLKNEYSEEVLIKYGYQLAL